MPIELYQIGKIIHFIGLISWFAALFYMPRLFIYHVEALQKEEPARSILAKQFNMMQMRLYHIIMTPAMIMTYIGGTMMLIFYGWDWLGANGWMHWKLLFVTLLTAYHHYNKVLIKKLKKDIIVMSSAQLRMYNEIATLLLVAIILLAVYKNGSSFLMDFAVLITVGVLLMLGIKAYKRYRVRKGQE